MEESDRFGGSQLVAGRRDSRSRSYVVWMARESVGPERDHHIWIDLTDQLRREPDQDSIVDFGEPAIRIVEAPRLGDPELPARRIKLFLPDRFQGRPGCASTLHVN